MRGRAIPSIHSVVLHVEQLISIQHCKTCKVVWCRSLILRPSMHEYRPGGVSVSYLRTAVTVSRGMSPAGSSFNPCQCPIFWDSVKYPPSV